MATKEEVKKGHMINAVCGVLCVSMIGGFIHFTQKPDPYPERIVDMEETVDAEYQKIIDNMEITTKEKALLDANTIKEKVKDTTESVGSFISGIQDKISSLVDKTEYREGYDKNGNPYLKKGASYTFKADGTPVEAPPDGKYTEIVNKNTGVSYMYAPSRYEWANLDEINKQIEFDERVSRGEINSKGTTGRALTQEEMDSVTWSVNVGSMGYK